MKIEPQSQSNSLFIKSITFYIDDFENIARLIDGFSTINDISLKGENGLDINSIELNEIKSAANKLDCNTVKAATIKTEDNAVSLEYDKDTVSIYVHNNDDKIRTQGLIAGIERITNKCKRYPWVAFTAVCIFFILLQFTLEYFAERFELFNPSYTPLFIGPIAFSFIFWGTDIIFQNKLYTKTRLESPIFFKRKKDDILIATAFFILGLFSSPTIQDVFEMIKSPATKNEVISDKENITKKPLN